MAEQYTFFYPPVIENFDELQENYDNNIKNYAIQCKNDYFNLLSNMNDTDAVSYTHLIKSPLIYYNQLYITFKD